MPIPAIRIREADRERLALAARTALKNPSAPLAATMLLGEIARATIIECDSPLPDVVAPHRDVEIYDNVTHTSRRLHLVYPGGDDADPDAISVLTPLGAALIGLSVGDTFDWCSKYGDRYSVTVLRA